MRLPASIWYFWKMGSFLNSSTLSLGMKGKMTSCSTVSRMVPSPYLQAHLQLQHLSSQGCLLTAETQPSYAAVLADRYGCLCNGVLGGYMDMDMDMTG